MRKYAEQQNVNSMVGVVVVPHQDTQSMLALVSSHRRTAAPAHYHATLDEIWTMMLQSGGSERDGLEQVLQQDTCRASRLALGAGLFLKKVLISQLIAKEHCTMLHVRHESLR
jgi:hypothetical protein